MSDCGNDPNSGVSPVGKMEAGRWKKPGKLFRYIGEVSEGGAAARYRKKPCSEGEDSG